jgi:serine O-acetyltransferase
MLTLILSDLRAKQRIYSEYGGRCSLLKAAMTDGTLANVLYRLAQMLVRWRLQPLAFAAHLLNKWINGCVIGIRADFGPGLVLAHPIGVVINSSVRAGRDVTVESGVVIGENRGRSPALGSGIFIGAGAKVIGGIAVGDGARIGANAVVLQDVAAGSTVVGIPARVVGEYRRTD